MKVRATKPCFYQNKYRYPGDVFTLVTVQGVSGTSPKERTKKIILKPEDQFSETCMEKVDGKKVTAKEETVTQAPPAPSVDAGNPTGDDDVI